MKKHIVKAIPLFFATFLISACGNTMTAEEQTTGRGAGNYYPVSIQVYTDEGKTVTQTIKQEPKKVVVIGEAMAELMIGFGLQEKVVGVGYLDQSLSKYAEQIAQMPVISKLWPSKEAVIALQPDLIYSLSSALKEDRVGDFSFWKERGIPVISAANFTVGRSIEEYFKDIKNFGIVFHVENQTEAYVKEQNERFDQIKKIASTAKTKPKVLFIAGAGRENYDYYPPSWCLIDEMIEGAGGEYMQLSKQGVEMSLESIIAANPEKIIVSEFQKTDREAIRNKLLSNQKLQNIQAIKTGNVMVADYTNAVRGSLQLADLYEDVAAFIHPELFGGK